MFKVIFSCFFNLVFQTQFLEQFNGHAVNQYKYHWSLKTVFLPLFSIVRLLIFKTNKSAEQIAAEMYPQINLRQLRYGDFLRFFIQSIWILCIKPATANKQQPKLKAKNQFYLFIDKLIRFPTFLTEQCLAQIQRYAETTAEPIKKPKSSNKIINALLFSVVILGAIICLTIPFNWQAQLIFSLLLFSLAMLVRHMQGYLPNAILLILSIFASSRYLWWRYTSTLSTESTLDIVLGLILLAAESYAWIVLILGYFQNIWPLNRKPIQLPTDTKSWPTVDLFIPTYNEDLEVLRPTVIAALGIDWPMHKLNIVILDDGKRDNIQEFAQQVGVGYIRRPTNEHAKAGNINYALKHTSGEFVAIFDCDHIPARSFLQMTMGEFLTQPKLALIQTPHHFYSPDPFERNLADMEEVPTEDKLFYGLVQDGSDMWGASFFCGSCAILRRSPLEEVGGIAIETVTEDAHTALKMHRLGYQSAYLRIPISAGLATETLSAHVGQRIRWARGMAQILRLDSPLLGKGLRWQQRLCYFNAMLHFLSGIPRIIFLLAPLGYLLFGAHLISAPAVIILLMVAPHMIHSNIANSRIQGKYRHNFWGEVYETVLAWYIAMPTFVALVAPHIGTFNVTSKGGAVEENYMDWGISKPYFVLISLNVLGLVFGGYAILSGADNAIGTVIFNLIWTVYNLLILGGAIGVAAETKQVRLSHRIQVENPSILRLASGHLYPALMKDFSIGGVRIELNDAQVCELGDKVQISLTRVSQECVFDCTVTFLGDKTIGLALSEMSRDKQIEYVQCTFARADSWSSLKNGNVEDRPLNSLKSVLAVGAKGYVHLLAHSPKIIKNKLKFVPKIPTFIGSYLPRSI
jgi:cellulose synthase (UDP-forming)